MEESVASGHGTTSMGMRWWKKFKQQSSRAREWTLNAGFSIEIWRSDGGMVVAVTTGLYRPISLDLTPLGPHPPMLA